ncbi:MAG: c-type cytochrome [Alphaproteobacteria bacterium]|nr:c-type cytochrome [Alphaproteobacteria bacterium]
MRRFLTASTMLSAIALAAFPLTSAQAAGNPANGAKVYQRCAACHSLNKGVNGIGPSLFGVVGRKAGTESGYAYSAALKNSGIVWTEDKLKEWSANPKTLVPGTKMMMFGAVQGADADDLVAYLNTKK